MLPLRWRMLAMDDGILGQALGTLDAEIKAVNTRLTEHITEERERDKLILSTVQEIQATLSQAKGAQKLVVWLLATIFAAIALAKGWIFPSK